MRTPADVIRRQDLAARLPDLPATPAPAEWMAGLRRSGKGFVGDEYNCVFALRHAPELIGLLRFNEFAHVTEFSRSPPWRVVTPGSPWSEADDTACQVWLQERDIAVRGRATVADSVALVSQATPHHPVRDYLANLKWDGEPRLRVWLSEYLNAEGDPLYLAAIGRAFLISAVARIQKPGCQADHMLVLEAAQGAGKTSAVRALSIEPAWYAGSLPDVHNKDAALQLCGRWIVEVSELRGMRTAHQEAVKSFLTETADTFRPPYGRRTAQFPRQCVFIGTTNEREYLRDRTGNRRYWPVRCGHVRLRQLTADRDQLWAEAMHEHQAGEAWHLEGELVTLAAAEQKARVEVTELEADVAQYLDRQRQAGVRIIDVQEVLTSGLGLRRDAPNYVETARRLGTSVAEAIESCGWIRSRRTRDGAGGRRTVYAYQGDGQGGQGK